MVETLAKQLKFSGADRGTAEIVQQNSVYATAESKICQLLHVTNICGPEEIWFLRCKIFKLHALLLPINSGRSDGHYF